MNMVLVVHWKVLKIDKGWFSVNQLEIHLIWENMMMRHSCEGLEYEELEKNQSKHGVIETSRCIIMISFNS